MVSNISSKLILRIGLITFLAFIGCASTGIFETGRTAPSGQIQIGGGISPFHIYGGGGVPVTFYTFPFPEIAFKYGVSENFDIGGRWAFGPGIALNTKYQFLKGASDGAIFLEASYYGMSTAGVGFGLLGLTPALIFSRESPGVFPYSFSVGLQYYSITGGVAGVTATGSVTSLIGGIGLPFRSGGQRAVRIMPQLSAMIPMFATFSAGGLGGSMTLMNVVSVNFGIEISYVGAERQELSPAPSRYSTIPPVAPSPTTTTTSPAKEKVSIISNWTSIFDSPSTQSQIIGRANQGGIYTLLGSQGEWYQIRLPDGKAGWIHVTTAEIK